VATSCGWRGEQAYRAHELLLAWQQQRDRDRADEREACQRQERAAPTDEIAEQAGNKASAKAADARAGNVDAGNPRHLSRWPFVADIGDSDGEDRRQ
jgi:hypothetical protein